MTRETIRDRQAEIADQNDRMAGLVVAILCGGFAASVCALAFALT